MEKRISSENAKFIDSIGWNIDEYSYEAEKVVRYLNENIDTINELIYFSKPALLEFIAKMPNGLSKDVIYNLNEESIEKLVTWARNEIVRSIRWGKYSIEIFGDKLDQYSSILAELDADIVSPVLDKLDKEAKRKVVSGLIKKRCDLRILNKLDKEERDEYAEDIKDYFVEQSDKWLKLIHGERPYEESIRVADMLETFSKYVPKDIINYNEIAEVVAKFCGYCAIKYVPENVADKIRNGKIKPYCWNVEVGEKIDIVQSKHDFIEEKEKNEQEVCLYGSSEFQNYMIDILKSKLEEERQAQSL